MKAPKRVEVKLRDIFSEDELVQFQGESIELSSSSALPEIKDTMEKESLKGLMFKILRNKLSQLNENYLLTTLSWLEKETVNLSSNKEPSDLQKENEELKQVINWIDRNCTVKMHQDIFSQYRPENGNKREITIQKIKEFSLQNGDRAVLQNDKFLSFSEEAISKIDTPDFNIFKLEEEVGPINILSVIGCYIFTSNGLYSLIKYNKFEKFVQEITRGYIRANPYHNDLHAADVTQTCMIYIQMGQFKELLQLNDLDLCALYISCISHDFRHPGVNNPFLANISNPIAIRYNDRNILESYHISQTFKLIRSSEQYNIFSLLNNDDYKTIRLRMIGLVLATDMVFHFKQFNFLKDLITKHQIAKGENRNKITEKVDKMFQLQQDLLEIVIHACDISNPTKPFDIYTFWADKVVEEFWMQGDKEKSLGLKVSMNCDRLTSTKAQVQVGFMDFIVGPFFTSFVEIFPELKFLTDNIQENTVIFKKIKEEEAKAKEKEKEKETKKM